MDLLELVLQVGYHVPGVDHPKTVWLRNRFGVFKGREWSYAFLFGSQRRRRVVFKLHMHLGGYPYG
jgi:hypothetical protein